jgi:hypothetical protein
MNVLAMGTRNLLSKLRGWINEDLTCTVHALLKASKLYHELDRHVLAIVAETVVFELALSRSS